MTSKLADSTVYQTRFYENAGLPELINLVDVSHKRILDLGCGNGANMRLLSAKGHLPTGLTLSPIEAAECRRLGLNCIIGNLSQGLPFRDNSFDALLLSHVLEHLAYPEEALTRILNLIPKGGAAYVALPNTLQVKQRYEFLRGRFTYTETGIMDKTHLRFFDFNSARQLLTGAGLKVITHAGAGRVPMRPIRQALPSLAEKIDRFGVRHWPGLFAIHILMVGIRE